jgi:hypothetical protein
MAAGEGRFAEEIAEPVELEVAPLPEPSAVGACLHAPGIEAVA